MGNIMPRIIIGMIIFFCTVNFMAGAQIPLRIGIAGLTHGHVGGAFNSAKIGTIQIVGIAEPDRSVAQRYAEKYGFSMDIVYPSLDEMLAARKPDAVAAFGSILQHLDVVRRCAPKRIHVMVEKPLAISADHAEEMISLAKRYGIFLLTNYETTWYETNRLTGKWTSQGKIGALRKIVIHDGHSGPKEIGVQPEFLSWLTDPAQNGGGAIIDFGCYGANLATWMMHGEMPASVTAITQQMKPEIYPRVDDEATIILTYPATQVIIQASWNWPYGRKDMEAYGTRGYIMAIDKYHLKFKEDSDDENSITVKDRAAPYNDSFSFFTSLISGEISLELNDLSGPENNLTVMKILDAARESARTGKTVPTIEASTPAK
jgi:predicted dehydrogenase